MLRRLPLSPLDPASSRRRAAAGSRVRAGLPIWLVLALLSAAWPAAAQITDLEIVSQPAQGFVETGNPADFVASCQGLLPPVAVPTAGLPGLVALMLALGSAALFALGRRRAALLVLLLLAASARDFPPPAEAQQPSCLDSLEWEARIGAEVFTGTGGSFSFTPTTTGDYEVTVVVPGPGGTTLVAAGTILSVCNAGEICDGERLLIGLGWRENNFLIDQMLYLGAGVADFEFELGFTTTSPEDPAVPSDWPAGVTVDLYDASGGVVAQYSQADVVADLDAPIVTPRIPGDRARIVISSGGAVVDLGSPTYLVLRRVEWSDAPSAAVDFDDALELHPGVEAIAYLANPGADAHRFYSDLPSPGSHSIYVSPSHFSPPTHDIGVSASWALGARLPTLPSTWDATATPWTGDTGIYEETAGGLPGQDRIFVGVEGTRRAFYRVTVQTPRVFIGNEADPLVVEMDGLMDGDMAPSLPQARVFSFASAHREQIDAFIEDDATYNRRIVETLVIQSASLLGSTEGYFRLDRADFYHSFDELRDVDILFDSECGRASAHFHSRLGPIAAINMWREYVNEPFDGGLTLTHEWGHYSFTIFDEYVEDAEGTRTVDRNSLMGSQRVAPEFCADLNHDDTGEDGDMIGPDSAWMNIETAFGVVPPRPPGSPAHYPQNRALYFDVLHRLESLLTIVEFPNPSPTGQPVNGVCSSVGDPCSRHGDCGGQDVCDFAVGLCVPAAGTGYDGDLCTHDNQCASNFCGANDRCELPPLLGEDCSDGRVCRDGRRCDSGPFSNGTNRCIPDDGEGQVGDYCSNSAHCMTGTSCRLEPDVVSSSCQPPSPLGGLCSDNAGCVSGACDPTVGTCVPINGTGNTGDYCTQDPHCASNDCLANACRSFAAIGEICSNGRICAAGRRCDTGVGSQNTGRCIPDDGEGQIGDFCSNDNHCLPGNACLLDPGQSSGTCQAPAPLGGECSGNGGCLSGACDVAARACVPLNGTGSTGDYCTQHPHCASNRCNLSTNACRSFAPIGAICSNGRICAAGRRCDTGFGSQNTGRCIPDNGEGQVGDFCSHNNHCMFPDSCRLDAGQNSGTCQPRSGLGGECSDNAGCLSGACDNVTRTCVPLNGTGSTGQYCTQDGHCQSNDCLSNACRSFAPIGAICSNGRICAAGRRCDSGPGSQNTGRCIPNDGQGTPGQFCSHNNQCLVGDFCNLASGSNSGVCSEPLALGVSCDGNHECASGACDPVVDRCVPINGTGGTGDYCSQDGHCASNDCLANACRSFAAIGEICSNGRICAAGRRCDQGIGTQNTGRCIPNDGQGQSGDFCSHNNQCRPGFPCNLLPGQNFGSCL